MDITLEKGFEKTYNNKCWKLFCRSCFNEGELNTAMKSICECGQRMYMISGKTERHIDKYIEKIKGRQEVEHVEI